MVSVKVAYTEEKAGARAMDVFLNQLQLLN